MRRDSHSIPGVIMAQIWMRIRKALADGRAFACIAMDDTNEHEA